MKNRIIATQENIDSFKIYRALTVGAATLVQPKDHPEAECSIVEGSEVTYGPYIIDGSPSCLIAAGLGAILACCESRTNPAVNREIIENLQAFVAALNVLEEANNTEIAIPIITDPDGNPIELGMVQHGVDTSDEGV